MTTYYFQCNQCFIVSGRMSQNPDDAPLCCGGKEMTAIPLEIIDNNSQTKNYTYTPDIGHYKNCPVCVGECICP